MSIWDNMTRSEQPNDDARSDAEEYFTVNFSTEKVRVPAGTSLRDAIMDNYVALGYDGQRTVTWRDSRGVVPETTPGEAGQTYMASVSLETKGL
jgi:hypothetical protein